MTLERWARLREETPALRSWTYLNCGFSGPISTTVVEAMETRLELELADGPTTRHVMRAGRELKAQLREAAARMFGCDAAEVAITGNTTQGLNAVTAALPLTSNDGIVTTSAEHGGGIVPAYQLRERSGADLTIVTVAPDEAPTVLAERFADAIDERTRLVLLSEISYSTGQLLPMAEIVEAARRVGALVVVDGAQTAGHLPLDVANSRVDAYAVPSHKWLCGPDGLGLLYVRKQRIPELDPAWVGGTAAESYDFEGSFTPRTDDIRKFEVSTVSAPLVAGTLAAVDQYLESGPDAVWARVCELNHVAQRRLTSIPGVEVVSPRADGAEAAAITGLLCFTVAGFDAALVATQLQYQHRVVCRSVAPMNAVRLSLHVYNTTSDVERAAEAVEQVVSSGIAREVEEIVAQQRVEMGRR
jgi:L-cysteine/cystine lyase